MIFFGIGTGAYTLVLAWLPPFYTQLGWSAAHSGLLLGGLTLTEVVAGLAISAVIDRFPDRRKLLYVVLLLLLAGLILLLIAPVSMAIPAALLLGVSIGALFPLSLIITMDHVSNVRNAGSLMGFVQGGGYIIASTMPFLGGAIRENFASLAQAWLVMAAGVIFLLILASRFSPDTKVDTTSIRLATK
ncbi:CP family cyanate transporter-like MFS transporter [Pseudomonas duriflava]|uniref:CP family cyanate transporter-like MFS transporter n=1 Tax=Pseudomonas duriflava TaxID=459528 RepID=A0A562Q7M0_9PSED|nr:CP family cyanate transporter-like MFS transporter [Pseudomonas duriflava]